MDVGTVRQAWRLPSAPGRLVGHWSSEAARRAVRAAVVVPALLAVTDRVIGNPQMATYATFAGFANLVLASFPGERRDKLEGHAGLAVAGGLLLTIGTAVHGVVAVAGVVTVAVTFLVLLAGSLGPKLAAGGLAAMLSYVLSAASPGSMSVVPSRLDGWLLGTAASALAVVVTSSRPPAAQLRLAAAATAGALAAEIRALASEGAPVPLAPLRDASLQAEQRLRTVFTATPYRPTGLAAVDQALGSLVELLQWTVDLVGDAAGDLAGVPALGGPDPSVLRCSATTLEAMATLLTGGAADVALERLEALRVESVTAVRRWSPGSPGYLAAVHASFHVRSVAVAVRSAAADVLVAVRQATPLAVAEQRVAWSAGAPGSRAATVDHSPVAAVALSVLRRHASLRSVWTRNAARGAVAVAAAVVVADLTNVQHGFWVVLGTLSVLRTTATSTGGTALRALLGTVAGVLVGAAIVTGVGTDTTVLWLVLPLAVLVAGYAPGVAPFAAGQAAFTAMLIVLYNLLLPVGWRVGVVRAEDIAVGCGISLVVGVMVWPRGATAVVARDLTDAFSTSAKYLVFAVDWALGRAEADPRVSTAALVAALRLDDAVRALLTEQGPAQIDKADLWALVGAAQRVRLTAASVAEIPVGSTDAVVTTILEERARLLAGWYEDIAGHLGVADGAAPEADAGAADAALPWLAGPSDLWRTCELYVDQHLRHLGLHRGDVVEPAERLGAAAHRPWWHPSAAVRTLQPAA